MKKLTMRMNLLKEGTHGCGKKLNYIKTPKHIIQINNNMRHSLSTIQKKMHLYNIAANSAWYS